MRGILSWRAAQWDDAIRYYTRAHAQGEQVGRSEVAFSALFWLAAALRDSGNLAGAETELAKALDICERAGLIAQSVEAISARAVALALAGRDEQARAAAEEAERLAGAAPLPGRPGREGGGGGSHRPGGGGLRGGDRGSPGAVAGAGTSASTRPAA